MKEKILVVDDEENLLNVIKDYLLRESYEVYTANRGNKAIELFRKIEESYSMVYILIKNIIFQLNSFTLLWLCIIMPIKIENIDFISPAMVPMLFLLKMLGVRRKKKWLL